MKRFHEKVNKGCCTKGKYVHKAVTILAVVMFLLIADHAHAGPTTYLPLGHRAYDFLEIMVHKFPLEKERLGIKPATRAEIARLLFCLEDKRRYMSPVEREEYLCLIDEFLPDHLDGSALAWDDDGPVERFPSFLSRYLYRNRRNFYSSRGQDYTFFFDPVIIRNADIGSNELGGDDKRYVSGSGFILRGTIGNHIGFHVDVRDSKETGSADYPEDASSTLPGIGYAKFTGDSAEFDETYAHVTWSSGPFIVSYDRDRNIWGRGKRGTLMLSGYGGPYDMIRFETSFGIARYMFFTGELEQYPPIAKSYYPAMTGVPADSVNVKKRISGHRLELALGDRLNIGLQETVIYGGDWDLGYSNPLMFLKGAEHSNGDSDNSAMGIDFRYFVNKAHSVYGELLIDDITTGKLGTDWYGNKLAWQIGTFLVRPMGLRDLDVRCEYTRLKPWVYTHKYPVNGYNHYGDVLGHPLGPNSDELFAEVRKRFTRRLMTSLSYSTARHGRNPSGRNIGGDPFNGFSSGDSKKSHFLDGDEVQYQALNFDVSYEPFWMFFVKAGYTRDMYEDEQSNRWRFSITFNGQ